MPSIHGRALSLDPISNNLQSHEIDITSPLADASITIGAESTASVRAITIQLKKSDGSDLDYVATVPIYLYTSSAKTAFAVTGGSTGLAIGADGALLAVVAKKVFMATCEADGDISLTYTDTATAESVCIGVGMPSGRVVTSSAFANA